MGFKDWTSNLDQRALSQDLFGAHGLSVFGAWFEAQVALIDDTEFARGFHAHINLRGSVQEDYSHRILRTSRGNILGGIRFFAGNAARPFVDVFAHTFSDDWSGLVDAVAAEWSLFEPKHLRVLLSQQEMQALTKAVSHATLDQSIHVARHAQMMPTDGRVTLAAFDDVKVAIAMMQQRYLDVAEQDPALGRNISPTPSDEIEALHGSGQLRAIRSEGRIVGLLAIAPDDLAWIKGGEVMEEVIETRYTGAGLATSAQTAWAASAPGHELMIGSIDGLNHASRRSAERAGRPAVLNYCFVPLGQDATR
jgi:RimJ/RimL family protein N-acetyltransferase